MSGFIQRRCAEEIECALCAPCLISFNYYPEGDCPQLKYVAHAAQAKPVDTPDATTVAATVVTTMITTEAVITDNPDEQLTTPTADNQSTATTA